MDPQVTIEGKNFGSPQHGQRLPTLRTVVVTGLLYLVIPVIFAVTSDRLIHAKGPDWLAPDYENPYTDLFNSLLILDGEPPEHIDHPGTTTHLFGALVLRSTSIKSKRDLINSAVTQPEPHLRKLQIALLAFTVLSFWIFPWITGLVLRNYLIGILIQAPSLFFQSVFSYALFFGSDFMVMPFTIISVCLCCLMIAPALAEKQPDILFGTGFGRTERVFLRVVRFPFIPASAGLICALGIAAKLTFFPLIVISFFCCRSLRDRITFSISFVLSLAIVLIPIYSRLAKLSTWIFSLGIHSGIYGHGSLGLPGGAQYLDSIQSLLQAEPLVVVIPLLAAIGVTMLCLTSLHRKTDSPRLSWKTALPLVALQIISFVAIAKHPSPHYLIPLCLSTGLSLVLLFLTLDSSNASTLRNSVAWVMLGGCLCLGLYGFVMETPRTYQALWEHKADLLRLYKHARQLTENDTVVYYYSSSSPEFAISFGNTFSGGVFGPILSARYPRALFFNPFLERFTTYNQEIDVESVLQHHDHLYFLGTPANLHQVDGLDPNTFETIDQAGNFCLQKWTRR
ncbi:MAG: hypothetical protein JO025_18805 [Verrucomicrobia bacterium]|nr:hypothetical protein [Verrucomicrobiota bacterium]